MTSIDRGDTVIALAGDWHGNTEWARVVIGLAADRGICTIHQLGDFGIYAHRAGRQYLDALEAACDETGTVLWVTPGNHEDWDLLDAGFSGAPGAPLFLRPHIAALPRGYRWTHAGRSFISVGGAPSVDYPQRQEGVSWWPSEVIKETVARTIAEAGAADILLSHDSSNTCSDAVGAIVSGNRRGYGADVIDYASRGRSMLDIVVAGTRPAVHAHGHYHTHDDVERDGTRVLSVDCDGARGNLVLLDLSQPAIGVEWVPTGWPEGTEALQRRRVREQRADQSWARFYTDREDQA